MNFAIIGAVGRMGQTIAQLSLVSKEVSLLAAVESEDNPYLGENYISRIGASPTKNAIVPIITIADLQKNIVLPGSSPNLSNELHGIIDFSSPQSSIEALHKAKDFNIPVVIGTTGFNQEELEQIKLFSKSIPILHSTNMSVGVNLLFYITQKTASILSKYNFDPEITEVHHRLKKDAPSGTAKTLSDMVLDGYNWSDDTMIYGREGLIGARPKKELGIHAIRGGDVVGEHTVSFFGDGEKIELYHQATSRNTFAAGAIEALLFLQNKSPGLYHMRDVLGFKD